MAYSTTELSKKYEELWEQQDTAFCSISEIGKKQLFLEKQQDILEKQQELLDYNYHEVKEKITIININYKDIVQKLGCIDKNLNQILDTIKLINSNQSNINSEIAFLKKKTNHYKILFYIALFILVCFIYK